MDKPLKTAEMITLYLLYKKIDSEFKGISFNHIGLIVLHDSLH